MGKSFDEIWEQIHQEQGWGNYPSEEVIRFVARNFYKRDRAVTRLLDAGCGAGAVTWYLAREGFAAYGFDGSRTAVRRAEKRLRDEGLGALLMVGDATNLIYSDEFFDGVIDSAMINANTVENIKLILRECRRVLKKGGKLFSTGLFRVGMTGYGTGERLEEHTYREITEGALAHRGTVHFFNRPEILELWSEAGFEDILIDSVERTDQGGAVSISHFIVEAVKS
ncbi:MAG: class I SAM-dependent methyltransferase [Firmicutes bacterium]|nr:class I SAM-dependent methyltransferase [Bacillota bacterium]